MCKVRNIFLGQWIFCIVKEFKKKKEDICIQLLVNFAQRKKDDKKCKGETKWLKKTRLKKQNKIRHS